MSRFYTVTFENITLALGSGDIDLFEISPAANKPCAFVGLLLNQITELGDAAEEQLRISILRVPVTATSGSSGTSAANNLLNADGTGAFTSETCNTTVATTTGTLVNLYPIPFNVRAGVELWFPPEARPTFINGTLGVVRLMAAVVDDITAGGALVVEELG